MSGARVPSGGTAEASRRLHDEAIWHDVECAGYGADVELWLELAAAAPPGRILDVGCGTGRVALELARAGHQVVALDSHPVLLGALAERARAAAVRIETIVADARSFSLPGSFALAIAPMQVTQLLGGGEGRRRMLSCLRRQLAPGGVFAAALADPFESVPAEDARPPLPDVHEEDGWVYSSTPVAVRPGAAGATVIERVREVVSPGGVLAEAFSSIALDAVTPERLEAEGRDCGFAVRDRRSVPPTDDYVGSAVVVLARPMEEGG